MRPPGCLYGLNCEAFVPVILEVRPRENFTPGVFSTNLLECEMRRFNPRRCLNVVDKTKNAQDVLARYSLSVPTRWLTFAIFSWRRNSLSSPAMRSGARGSQKIAV